MRKQSTGLHWFWLYVFIICAGIWTLVLIPLWQVFVKGIE